VISEFLSLPILKSVQRIIRMRLVRASCDIHSPRIPTVEEMVDLLRKADGIVSGSDLG
jgi:hypothetical protein